MSFNRVKTFDNTQKRSIEDIRERFKKYEDSVIIEPEYIYEVYRKPNDSMFDDQWSLNSMLGQKHINVQHVWDTYTDSPDIVVAVLDTGIAYNHDDLNSNIWKNNHEIAGNGIDDDGNGYVDDHIGWDFFYHDADPMDRHGHGTHVAGCVGGCWK